MGGKEDVPGQLDQNSLLEEEKAHDQSEPPQVRPLAEDLAPACRVGLLLLDLGPDLEEFLVVGPISVMFDTTTAAAVQKVERVDRLGVSPFQAEPARRLGHPKRKDEQHRGWDVLQAEQQPPRSVPANEVKAETDALRD